MQKRKGKDDFVAYSDGDLDIAKEEPLNKVTGRSTKNFYGKNFRTPRYNESFIKAETEKKLMNEGSFSKKDVPLKVLGLKFVSEEKLTALI